MAGPGRNARADASGWSELLFRRGNRGRARRRGRKPRRKKGDRSKIGHSARLVVMYTLRRAEAVLLLRCIEVNGDREDFMESSQAESSEQLRRGTVLQIRSQVPTQFPVAA